MCIGDRFESKLNKQFHVAMLLFTHRSQMTSNVVRTKKVAHERLGKCVTDVLTTCLSLLTEQMHSNMQSGPEKPRWGEVKCINEN